MALPYLSVAFVLGSCRNIEHWDRERRVEVIVQARTAVDGLNLVLLLSIGADSPLAQKLLPNIVSGAKPPNGEGFSMAVAFGGVDVALYASP